MKKSNSKGILYFFLAIMAAMIVLSIIFLEQITELLISSSLHRHILFIHILSVTLFFANAVIGILWELRSLASNQKQIILHTYDTVAWLDACFSSPLIISSVVSGILLTLMYGPILEIGWLFLAFVLFLLSGMFWIISDIPTQYKIKKLIGEVDAQADVLPDELLKLLKKRLWISLGGVLPLVIVFILMVYKPEIPSVAALFQ